MSALSSQETSASHIDLFSGIGGFSIGFEREGFETVAFCEIDARCRAVLGHHWPRVPIYTDVRADGGLPVSGLVGSWQEDRARRLSELVDVRPDWVVVENVHHSWKRWVPELRSQLHAIGYASVPLLVSALDVGARHARRRVYVVAHSNGQQLWKLSWWWQWAGRQVADELAESWDSAPRGLGTNDGLPTWTHRRHGLGNAVVPNAAQLVARAIRSVA